MADRYLLALDQGTTSTRAILFDAEGGPRASRQVELPQIYPQPGWVEHDRRGDLARDRLGAQAHVSPMRDVAATDIAAIGITNQRETTVLWDRASGKPIHNAIVWQDRRTAEFCRRMADEAATTSSATAPACCSTRISPARRSPGCSTTSPARAQAAEARRARLRHHRQRSCCGG